MGEAADRTDIPRPLDDVFTLFASPRRLVALAPADLNLELVEGPERLFLGSTVTWKARRFGIAQRMTSEITAFEEGVRIVEEQRKGPFARWIVTRRFEAVGDATRLHESVAFEPPRGMLGLLVSEAKILADLQKMFAARAEKLAEWAGG